MMTDHLNRTPATSFAGNDEHDEDKATLSLERKMVLADQKQGHDLEQDQVVVCAEHADRRTVPYPTLSSSSLSSSS
jgi:hypothetical protein